MLKKFIEFFYCSGDFFREIGKDIFDIVIGLFIFKRELIVVGIVDEGFLGMDILMEGGKFVDVLLSRGVILFCGEEI